MTDDMLRGWKEIADFLKISESTAIRYERNGNMPVIRLFNGQIVGMRSELKAWIVKVAALTEHDNK